MSLFTLLLGEMVIAMASNLHVAKQLLGPCKGTGGYHFSTSLMVVTGIATSLACRFLYRYSGSKNFNTLECFPVIDVNLQSLKYVVERRVYCIK